MTLPAGLGALSRAHSRSSPAIAGLDWNNLIMEVRKLKLSDNDEFVGHRLVVKSDIIQKDA